jgi:outer membrane protein assembly factor BamB
MKRGFRLLAVMGLVATTSLLTAADWPQWRGPDRTGVSRETGLLREWPEGGPKLLWKNEDVGKGFSTPSEAEGRVYLLGNDDDNEFVLALDAKNGKKVWSREIGKVGPNRGPQYPGARSTPTMAGDVLYALGSDGDLVCLETAEGKERWRKNLRTDFGGVPGNWAYSESPLVDGDKVVCTPGGKDATLVALDRKDGTVVWKAKVPGGDAAAYSSAIIARAGKVKMYVQFLGKGLVGVDAATGKFLWRYARSSLGSAANIPTPVYHDGYVFSSTGQGQGGLVKLTATDDGVSAEEVWSSKQLSANIGGVVLVDGYLYGTSGKGDLFCAEFRTGEVKWENKSVGTASICYADGRLYLHGDGGTFRVGPSSVALVEATPAGYKEKGRFRQPDRSRVRPAWPYPIVANGRLYLRDQNVLLCYDVKAKSEKE